MENIFNRISEELNDKDSTPEKCNAVISALFTLKSNQKFGRIKIPFLIDIQFKKKLKRFLTAYKH
jgi:hypothetical protein